MFEQFLSLIREKIEKGVEAEGEHPVPWQQIQQRGESEPCGGRGEEGLDWQNEMQPGNVQAMLQHGSQAMAVDLLFTEQAGFKRQSVSKQWPCREFADQGLAFHPGVSARRL